MKELKLWILAMPVSLAVLLFLFGAVIGVFGIIIIPMAIFESSEVIKEGDNPWSMLWLIPLSWVYMVAFIKTFEDWKWFNEEMNNNQDSYLWRACVEIILIMVVMVNYFPNGAG